MSERIAPQADRPYFAAFLDLRGKRGLVVGGGPVAALKAETLLRSGAQVTVVAPERDRSGSSNSLTLDRPMTVRRAPSGFFFVNGPSSYV